MAGRKYVATAKCVLVDVAAEADAVKRRGRVAICRGYDHTYVYPDADNWNGGSRIQCRI